MIRAEKYDKGDLILIEGQRGGEAFVVEHGRVQVFRAGPPELTLAVLGPGQIFGEMGLISELPRSASVRAVEDVEIGVIGRDEFLEHLRTTPDALLPFLRTLSERIRSLSSLVEELARKSPSAREAVRAHLGGEAPIAQATSPALHLRVTLEGITPLATDVLDGHAVVVDHFPYRIGRRTSPDDPFSANELAIPDASPWWVSRSHCMLAQADDRCFLIDRGSRLGTLVDGKMVGGNKQTSRLELGVGEHEVRLGGALTPFRFSFVVKANGHAPTHRRRPRRVER